MTNWFTPLLEAVRKSESAEEAFEAIADAARHLGFEWCAYGYQHPLPFTQNHCFMISNYAESWRTRYEEAGYLDVDPTVIHARSSIEPMVWSDDSFRTATQLWDEARTFGLRHGWAQSCFGPDGAVGLLSLARDHEPIGNAELLNKEAELRGLVNVAHAALSRFACGETCPTHWHLTRREREVMCWAADGKTSAETAEILGLSRFTVEFHFRNAVHKVGAGNRAAAVARAAAVGILR